MGHQAELAWGGGGAREQYKWSIPVLLHTSVASFMSEKYNLHKAMQIIESWVESQLHHFSEKAAVTISPTSVDNEQD